MPYGTALGTVARMPRDPSAGLLKMLGRALRRCCPRCGGRRIFAGFWRMREWCPTCGFRFEREPGYFVGAMTINTAVTVVAILGTLAAGWWITWPDVAYGPLMAILLVIGGLTPVIFYPWSKTVWTAIELSYHQLEESERIAAIDRMENPFL